ncbi:MAG: SseB family protein [Oscillospiraceae bacterium]|nr:SseB family protein [Oscillospiraceae bacterium]
MANQQLTPEQMKVFNKALEERITEANEDKTKTKWKKVLPDLMAADVFAVAALGDKTDANGNRLLNVMMMTSKDGQQAIPFFTSPNRMSVLATPEHKTFNCMKINTTRLFNAIKGKTAVLNPGSPCSRVFTPFEMNLLVMENKDQLEVKPAPAPTPAPTDTLVEE